jgi:putative sugar O-methyltransferase
MVLHRIKKILLTLFCSLLTFKLHEFLAFINNRTMYSKKYNEFIESTVKKGLEFYPAGTYEWDLWRRELQDKFSHNLPIYFLHNKLISGTMVFGNSKYQREKISYIESALNKNEIKNILRESIVGLPAITNFKYLASENSIHQLFHIASYKKKTNKNILSNKFIVEWGGGYGCLARMAKKINPTCTYVIMDLPELSALQFVYLTSIFGKDEVNFIGSESIIEEGKINLISSDYFISLKKEITADAFISNWALTESGKDYQDYILESMFFSAGDILIGCINDDNNYLFGPELDCFDKKVQIDILGDGNFYLMK